MKKRPKYFMRLLLSSIVIFIISLFSGTLIYRLAYDVLEEEISKSNYSSVEHFSELFDAKLTEVFNIHNQISNDTVIRNLLTADSNKQDITIIEELVTRRRLESIKSESADDIFVYLPNINRIVSSTHTSFNLERHFYTYYDSSTEEYDALMAQMQKSNICSIHTVKGMEHIFIMQNVPHIGFKSGSSVSVYSMSPTYLANLFNEWTPENGIIMVVDNDNNVVLSSDKSFVTSDYQLDSSVNTYKSSKHSIAAMINGEEHMVQTIRSANFNYSYVFAMPTAVYYDKLDSLRVTSFSIFFVFFCVGMIISWLLTKRNYHPISEIVQDIQTIIPEDSDHPGDLDYIRTAFSSMLSEKERMKYVIRDDMLGKILKGKYSKDIPLHKQFEDAGIELVSDNFAVWLLKTYGDHEYEACDTYTEELCDVWENRGHRAYRVRLNRETHAYIVNVDDRLPYHVEDIASEVLNTAKGNYNLICTVSCGDVYHDIEGIYRSYTEVEAAMEYSAVQGPGSFIYHGNVFKGDFRYLFSFRNTAEQLMLSCIKTGEPSAKDVMLTIKNNCCGGEIRLPDEFKCYYFDVVTLFRRIADKLELNHEILQGLQSCTDLIGFDEAAIELLQQLNELYVIPESHEVDHKSVELCDKIKKYIFENHADANLSLASISEAFDFSEAYLTRVFRKVESTTVAVYISHVRIENAKHLLRDTDQTIADIAQECGFMSSTAFIRLFKKHVGLTPGAYRKNDDEQN